MRTLTAKAGNVLIGAGNPIVVQTMCNTHTSDVDATVAQCVRLYEAGSEMIRITVPGPADVECVKSIKSRLKELGINVPIVADIHFSSQTAIMVAPFVEKVRINPGNSSPDSSKSAGKMERQYVSVSITALWVTTSQIYTATLRKRWPKLPWNG